METKLIKTWGVAIVLFLAVFAGCLVAIFQPVYIVTESYGTTSKVASFIDTSKTVSYTHLTLPTTPYV